MTRVTLDANVLAPAVLNRRSASGRIVRACFAGVSDLVLSEHMLTELANTLDSRYFRERLSEAEIGQFLTKLRVVALVVPIQIEVHGVATHPEDDKVLATALSGRSDYLCTHDRQLLKLGSFHDIAIITPSRLLHVLELDTL
ncbi:MAG: putative toxin-antitoxin system toxin component, PIN family [Chloroflexota bacterium]|nr:putative toxin-antitoxin system toxin component, PIN family [Chloroflexota bacterium]